MCDKPKADDVEADDAEADDTESDDIDLDQKDEGTDEDSEINPMENDNFFEGDLVISKEVIDAFYGDPKDVSVSNTYSMQLTTFHLCIAIPYCMKS